MDFPMRLDCAGPLDRRGAGVYFARFARAGQVRRGDQRLAGLGLPASVLQIAALAGRFENRAVFIDHSPPGRHPSLGRLAGVTGATAWNPVELAVEGELRLYDTPAGRQAAGLLDALLADPPAAPDVGLSMVFYPVWDGEDLLAIRYVESVDLVFAPAADGRVLHVIAPQTSDLSVEGKEGDCPVTTEDLTLVQTLNASGLPRPSRERLAAGAYADEAALQAAIAAERRYLADLQQEQVVQIGGTAPRGGTRIEGMTTGLDRVQLALEALLAGTRPAGGVQPLTGIRELYHLLSGDYEMSGVFQPERVQLANVTSATMSSLVANALNKVVAAEFIQYPRWWEPVTVQRDFASLQAVRWITLGGIGELPTVAEGGPYTELTWDDNYETASFVKKGGYLGITLEAIDKDDTGRLAAAPRALAQAAWLTLSKTLAGLFTANAGAGPDLLDGLALFHASRGNLGSAALSISAYSAARAAMRRFTEPGSGEALGPLTAPRYLLVPPDLELAALQVLASEFDYSYSAANTPAAPVNPLAEGEGSAARLNLARSRVIVVDLWDDPNNWAALADPRLWPSIGLGFRYGRTPEIFSVASPTAGLMFTHDTLPVKARFVFAAGPVDWRGMYKANVA